MSTHYRLPLLCWIGVLTILLFTRVAPNPNAPFIAESQLAQLAAIIGDIGITARSPPPLPEHWSGVPAGSGAMSIWHFVGTGVYFFLAALCIIAGLDEPDGRKWPVIVLGTAVTIMYAGMIAPSLVGLTMHQPTRWFPYIYFVSSVLGALGIYLVYSRFPLTPEARTVLVIIMMIVAVGLMSVSYWGAPDGSPIGGPGAQDFSVDEQGQSLFLFVVEHTESRIVSDDLTAVVLSRHYGKNAIGLRVTEGYDSENARVGGLIVERPYSHSSQATYRLLINGQSVAVAGGVPETTIACQTDNKFYSSGNEYSIRVKTQNHCGD